MNRHAIVLSSVALLAACGPSSPPPSSSASPSAAPPSSAAPPAAPPFEGTIETSTETFGNTSGCEKCPKLKTLWTIKGRRFRLDAETMSMGSVTTSATAFDLEAQTITQIGLPNGAMPWRPEKKAPPAYRPTDRREVIAGVSCRVWIDPEVSGSLRRELCIAPLGVSLTEERGGPYAGGGFDLRTDTFTPPSYALSSREVVVRIDRRAVDDSVFR